MTLITTLTLIHETEDSAHYAEGPDEDRYPLLGTVSVHKWALPRPTPTAIRLTLEAYEAECPSPSTRTAEEARRIHEAADVLEQGATVVIVKNRLAGIRQPPEWLEQYLGRKGTVLWTTAGGAMVKLDKEATWFPYAELTVED
ncbi:MAG: hypothetical protein A2133_10235 [Actinobacteria bacterium RBG_16_64_13]|nr:MAG: hypothetical protein A2133_10235 [Actinobacteria bacterium RBG_16_64_13]